MENIKDFVKQLVKIDYAEQWGGFGHYPFQLYAETEGGQAEMNALALGGNVNACYLRFRKYLKEGAKRIYMSLDFPKGGDIENDFVCVFSYENAEHQIFAIPYETEGGKTFPQIKESSLLSKILGDFIQITSHP